MTRWIRWLMMAALTAGAAWPSYLHGLFVVREVGNTGNVAYDLPLLPDGLIGVATVALIQAAREKAGRPGWATAGLALGILLTTVQNVASGYPRGPGAMVVNGLVPLILIIALEILVWSSRLNRSSKEISLNLYDPDAPEPVNPPDLNVDLLWIAGRHSRRQLAELLGVHHQTVGRRIERARAAVAEVAAEVQLNGSGPGG